MFRFIYRLFSWTPGSTAPEPEAVAPDAPPQLLISDDEAETQFELFKIAPRDVARRALVRLSNLRGEQAADILVRILDLIPELPRDKKTLPVESHICEESIVGAASLLSAEQLLRFVPYVTHSDQTVRNAACRIIQGCEKERSVRACQERIAIALAGETVAIQRRLIAALSKPLGENEYETDSFWYSELRTELPRLLPLLSTPTVDDEGASLVCEVLGIIRLVPRALASAGAAVDAVTRSENPQVRGPAVSCRLEMLYRENFPLFGSALLGYLDGADGEIRLAAAETLSGFKSYGIYGRSSVDKPLDSLGPELLERALESNSPYPLRWTVARLSFVIPAPDASRLANARRGNLLCGEHFARLMKKVAPDWGSMEFVSAWVELISGEKGRSELLRREPSVCPWQTALEMLSGANPEVFVATISQSQAASVAAKFFECMEKVSSDLFYRKGVLSTRERPSGEWIRSPEAASATKLLVRLCEVPWAEAELWKIYERSDRKNRGLLDILQRIENADLISARAAKLLEGSERLLTEAEIDFVLKSSNRWSGGSRKDAIVAGLVGLYTRLARNEHRHVAEDVLGVISSLNPRAAAEALRGSQQSVPNPV